MQLIIREEHILLSCSCFLMWPNYCIRVGDTRYDALCLIHGCVTLTLISNLKGQNEFHLLVSNFAESRSITDINMPHQQSCDDNASSSIIYIFCECQAQLYGHMAHFPKLDTAPCVVFIKRPLSGGQSSPDRVHDFSEFTHSTWRCLE